MDVDRQRPVGSGSACSRALRSSGSTAAHSLLAGSTVVTSAGQVTMPAPLLFARTLTSAVVGEAGDVLFATAVQHEVRAVVPDVPDHSRSVAGYVHPHDAALTRRLVHQRRDRHGTIIRSRPGCSLVTQLERPGALTAPPPVDALLLTIAIAGVSTSGPLIAATAAPALAIAMWRNAMASGALLPLALGRRETRAELRGLDRRERRMAVLAGLLLAAHFATWIPSVTFTSVAAATALVATQPVWAALLVRARGGVLPRTAWVGIGLAVAGAAVITGVDVGVGTRHLVGDLLALAGGALAAGYVTAGGEVRRSVGTTTYTAVCYSVTSVVLLVVCLVGRQHLTGYSGGAWLRIVALTVGAQLLGHSLINVVLRATGPLVVSLAILFEVPGATLLAVIFLHQHVRLGQLPGAVLLLAGIALVVRAGARAQPVE